MVGRTRARRRQHTKITYVRVRPVDKVDAPDVPQRGAAHLDRHRLVHRHRHLDREMLIRPAGQYGLALLAADGMPQIRPIPPFRLGPFQPMALFLGFQGDDFGMEREFYAVPPAGRLYRADRAEVLQRLFRQPRRVVRLRETFLPILARLTKTQPIGQPEPRRLVGALDEVPHALILRERRTAGNGHPCRRQAEMPNLDWILVRRLHQCRSLPHRWSFQRQTSKSATTVGPNRHRMQSFGYSHFGLSGMNASRPFNASTRARRWM